MSLLQHGGRAGGLQSATPPIYHTERQDYGCHEFWIIQDWIKVPLKQNPMIFYLIEYAFPPPDPRLPLNKWLYIISQSLLRGCVKGRKGVKWGVQPGKKNKLAVIVFRDFEYGLWEGIYTGCKRDVAVLVCIISGRNVNRSFIFLRPDARSANFFRSSGNWQKQQGLTFRATSLSPRWSETNPVPNRGHL
jgi:hypothetical protein